MKKFNLFSLCLVLLLLCTVCLSGCKENKSKETVTAKTEVHTIEDTRPDAYEVHAVNGELVDTYSSLYNAIYACVNDGDIDDYVTKVDSEEKLFINYSKYAESTYDMFWYYDQGASLIDYKAWDDGYWQTTKDYGNAIAVRKSGEYGEVTYYANSHQIIMQNDQLSDYDLEAYPGNTREWNVSWLLETNATVDMAPYSGITKEVYEIQLSEAMIAPSMDSETHAWAFVGFFTCDGSGISQMGLRCDTTTGNWYYYNGVVNYDVNDLEMDDEKCLLTSTWDEAYQCFRPDGNVIMTCELLTIVDEEFNDSYIVHRLTMEFSDGRKVVRDLESDILTQCGTIRFTSGIDLESDRDLQDYMCGAKFKNLVVTSAEATIYEEMKDLDNYGNFAAFDAGEYDILNSNPATIARFHTIVYTPSCVTTDFTTPGRDVYSYEFKCQSDLPAYGGALGDAINKINAIPAISDLTSDDAQLITDAREAYDKLRDTQKDLVKNYDHLVSAEENLEITSYPPLMYSGQNGENNFFDGALNYDKETGKYTLTIDLVLWGRIKFSYDGEPLNATNTNLTGYIIHTKNADWTENLYYVDDDISQLISSKGGKYTFTFDPETNTLNIDVYIRQVADTEVIVQDTNNDSECTVWTEEGTKLREITGTQTDLLGQISKVDYYWVGNQGWRMYIVCDNDGKIMYLVAMPPNGYGGPSGDGYYCHSDYNDYTKNSAFIIHDGYAPWSLEAPQPSNLFEVVVPEGGFAITCHGASMNKLIELISDGKITAYSDADIANINNRSLGSDDIRIVYDSENGVINVVKNG